jgi:propanol-preferring alcohol dehydrogenase
VIDDLVPGPGEISIDVAACGVCRTDLQIVEGDLAARTLPIVPGHQIVGRVLRVGDGVTEWSVGERAGAGWLGGACGSCEYCRSGRENLCADAEFNGWDRDGGYAEQAVVRADYALRIPPSFSDVDAAPLLCGGIIGYRSLKISGIRPGGRLGLYGFGASALLAMQVALHWGCDVFVATRSPTEQQRAIEMGAAWTGSYHDRPPVALDAAVTFAPAGYVVIEALKSIARGGVVAINAIHLDRVPTFGYDLLWGERQIRSVANFTLEDATEFLELAGEIPIRTVPDVYPLADANLALQRLKEGQVSGAAVLVTGE